MPYRIDFNPQHRILRGRFDGTVTDDELREFYRIGEKYAARTAPHAGLVDFSAIAAIKVSERTVIRLASGPPLMPDRTRPRFVVAPSLEVFKLSRVFQMVGEMSRPNLHIVFSADEVWKFLRVAEPRFEPMEFELPQP